MSFSLSEYTKIDVGCGFSPDPMGRTYRAPPDLLAGFKWVERLGEGRGEGERGREGKRGKD